MKSFTEKIYAQLKKVPAGKVVTYKSLAKALNSKAFRAVGTAMKNNTQAPIIPCHRVINSDGKIGNYSGEGSVLKKIELLRKEGVEVIDGKIELDIYEHKF